MTLQGAERARPDPPSLHFLTVVDKKVEFELNDDLPGLGQYYCPPCARHFISSDSLSKHTKSKVRMLFAI